MLVTLQFPLCDARSLIDGCGRLERPAWPTPKPEEEFVRSFGKIRQRHRGGVGSWVAEDCLCMAHRAVRIPPSTQAQRLEARGFRVAARTLYFGGSGAGKVEISIAGLGPPPKTSVAEICRDFLALPVVVPDSFTRHPFAGPLIEAGKPLAHLYLAATTTRDGRAAAAANPWWVEAGTPLLVVERTASERRPLGADAGESFAAAGTLPAAAYLVLEQRGRCAGLWVCTASLPKRLSPTETRARRTAARELRISLLRIHAEREALFAVLRLLKTGKIPPAPDGTVDDRVQRLLDKATARILHTEEAANLPIVAVANRYDDQIQPGARQAAQEQIEEIMAQQRVRGTLGRRTTALLRATAHVTLAQRMALNQALVDAFKLDELRMMLFLELGLRLDLVTADGPLPQVVAAVLLWAEDEARLDDLAAAALRTNPNNPQLQQYAARFGVPGKA